MSVGVWSASQSSTSADILPQELVEHSCVVSMGASRIHAVASSSSLSPPLLTRRGLTTHAGICIWAFCGRGLGGVEERRRTRREEGERRRRRRREGGDGREEKEEMVKMGWPH